MITAPFPATSHTPSLPYPVQRFGGAVVTLIFFLAGCGFFYVMAAHPFLQSLAARNWVETPCRVVSSEVKSGHDKDGTTYHADIAYVYQVQGRQYHGNRTQFLRFSSGGRANQAAVAARYPRGKQTVCFVDPKAPNESVLDRNFSSAGFFTLIPLVFMGVGGTLFFRTIRGGALQSALPDGELWRTRPDWVAGRVVSSAKQGLWMAWLFATAWNLFSFPAAWSILNKSVFHHALNPAALVVLFPLVGLGLLGWAIVTTRRWMSFGESVLELGTVPAVPGGAVEGTVRLSHPIRPEAPVRLWLKCLERLTSGGENRSTRENLLWQREETAEMAAACDALPVAFALPPDASVTTTCNGADGVFWRLEVHAKLPGVDYKAQFELPVCAGEISPEQVETVARVQSREEAEVAAYVQPVSSRVQITTPLRGGTEFYFPPGRSLGGSLIPAAILAGLCWGMNLAVARHESLGMLFALGLGIFIMGFILSYIWTASTRVNVEAGLVTVTRSFLGIHKTRMVPAADIAKIKTEISGSSSGPSGTTVFHRLTIVCRDENEFSAGGRIPGQQEAEWVAARMTQALRTP